jgi:hypothetical protein
MHFHTQTQFRLKMLEEADRNLSTARALTSSGDPSFLWPRMRLFMGHMDRAASSYAACDLGLLARRVRATRDKCCNVLRLKPKEQHATFIAIWQQFDKLNCKDHFDYTARNLGLK